MLLRRFRPALSTGVPAMLLAVFLGAAPAHTATVAVTNPGFETPFANNGFVIIGAPVGWSIYNAANINGTSDSVGVINPAGTAHFPAGAAEGRNAAVIFMDGPATGEAGLEQTLAATLQAERRYTLRVEVGNIAAGTANFGYFNLAGFPGYRVDLLAGTNVLASDNNTLAGSIPEGEFRTATVVASIGATNAALGAALRIRLVNLNISGPPAEPGIEVNFDNVRLTEEPRRPVLSGRRAPGGGLELHWVDVSGRFTLQSATNLPSVAWQNVPGVPTATNGSNFVSLPATGAGSFLRLHAAE